MILAMLANLGMYYFGKKNPLNMFAAGMCCAAAVCYGCAVLN